MDEIEGLEYYQRTYSLKVKDGKYAWIYDDDDSERFPGVTFDSPQAAEDYFTQGGYGKTFVKWMK